MKATAASFEPVTGDAFGTMFEQVFETAEALEAALSVDIMQSPVGTLMLAASEAALCSLEFVDAESLEARLRLLRRQHVGAAVFEANQILDRARSQLDDYFAGRRTTFDVPLSYAGTPFQQKVWSALCEIAYGCTWSYLDLARRVGDVGATRAVGMANGANPIAIVIPCHRVVNASGQLGGYGGGLWRKRTLLDLEKGQGQLAF
jgi:O-6-methylguanine DNA methyltransferase